MSHNPGCPTASREAQTSDQLLTDARAVARHAADMAHGCFPCATVDCKCTDRKSTRLNSSHSQISYAVFCLKKKKTSAILRLRHVRVAAHARHSEQLRS